MGFMAKAWVACFMAVLTSVSVALSDDVFDINDTTQVVIGAIGAVGTLYAVYKKRNTVPPPAPRA